MSTIWTPGGEYVPRPQPGEQPGPGAGAPPGRAEPGQAGAPGDTAQPSPEEIETALAEARAILAVPVIQHIAGHAMAFLELAALHLEREAATEGKEQPDFAEASLAIDALAALVEGLGSRLGPHQASLTQALAQVRMVYVQRSRAGGESPSPGGGG